MGMTYQKCSACGGRGTVNNKSCPRCDGSGKTRGPMPAPEKSAKKKGFLGKLLPMSPTSGPPLPSGADIHWPKTPERLKKGVNLVPEVGVPSPFGTFHLPRYGLPPLKRPELTPERKAALRHALGSDASQVIALIPLVGDTAADALEDMHMAEVRRILTPAEFDRFIQETKVAPDTVALIKTFMHLG